MALKYSVGEIARRINNIAVEGLTGERTAASTIVFLTSCIDKLLAGEFPDPAQFGEMLEEDLAVAA